MTKKIAYKLPNSARDWVFEGRRIVTYADLNPQHTLFGGKMVQWMDEAAAIYGICQMDTKHIVTLRITELLFKLPVFLHDVLEFQCRALKRGKTSLTIEVQVYTILGRKNKTVCTAEFQFVAVNKTGKSVKW
jgi:acyl-CoA hydrolase